MTYHSGFGRLVLSVGTLFLLAVVSSSCGKPSPTPDSNNPASASPAGINGVYLAGVKRSDGVVELFKLEVTRQGNDVSGVLYFLSSMLDSIDSYTDNPQKIDVQNFDSFAGRPPAKLSGKINGNAIEFNQPEPMVVGNYIYSWHFTGQVQADKLQGQLEEKFKNDDKDEATENAQTMNVAFTRAENK
jgi:hypothetical protein